VFDGTELLEGSIKSIKDSVDYIVIVYQNVSNYGEIQNNDSFIQDLLNRKLIDKAVFYEPNFSKTPKINETIKRNIGLNILREQNCTHHMNLDADEYWFHDQLEYAKKEILKNKYDATIARNIRYYKFPTIQTTYNFNDYAPCIYSTKFDLGNFNLRYAVDPSRKPNTKKVFAFDSNVVVMHHYWMIRNNLDQKFKNKSSQGNFNRNLEKTMEKYREYKHGDKIEFWLRGRHCICEPNIVPNYFNIDIKI
jgi:hypothetical protein